MISSRTIGEYRATKRRKNAAWSPLHALEGSRASVVRAGGNGWSSLSCDSFLRPHPEGHACKSIGFFEHLLPFDGKEEIDQKHRCMRMRRPLGEGGNGGITRDRRKWKRRNGCAFLRADDRMVQEHAERHGALPLHDLVRDFTRA